ncbi:MAG: ChaN family lipoprotein [Ramlibacter sp.]
MRILLAAPLIAVLAGCAVPPDAARIDILQAADVAMLGEQHDAPEHQQIHLEVVHALAGRGRLAALALEMAPEGGSTIALPRDAGEPAVQAALRWDDAAWPWSSYAPAVMAAVRSGVPVVGANLPRAAMRAAMADVALDAALAPTALKAQQQAIRAGHCDMLPESQIAPMTRIQIARDRAMARTVAKAVEPGKTVVLLAGASHVDRRLGVTLHLPAQLRVASVALRAGARASDEAGAAFDTTWPTPAIAPRDYCAGLRPQPASSMR